MHFDVKFIMHAKFIMRGFQPLIIQDSNNHESFYLNQLTFRLLCQNKSKPEILINCEEGLYSERARYFSAGSH